MQYLRLGNSGLKVSRLAYGCMSFGDATKGWHPWIRNEEEGRSLIKAALESGINFFDTANAYAEGTSEEVLGRAVKDFAKRDELVIASKVHMRMNQSPNGAGLSRKAILSEAENSLSRLGTDYIDLYQIHHWDAETPIEETLEALNDLVRSGKVRYIGASNTSAWQFCKALYISGQRGWSTFVSMQAQLNLLYREEEREMLPLCADQGIGILPWSPLARGKLSRPWSDETATDRDKTDPVSQRLYGKTKQADKAVVDATVTVANNLGVSPSQVALAWLLTKPEVTAPIIGATKKKYLDEAIEALDISLDEQSIEMLEKDYVPHASLL